MKYTVSATDARSRFGEIMRRAIKGPVVIERDGEPEAVVLSKQQYDQLVSNASKKDWQETLEGLHERLRGTPHPIQKISSANNGKSEISDSSTICIDASMVVRLTLQPDDSIIKELWGSWISGGNRLVAPTLLYYEVEKAFYELERRRLLSSEFVRDALDFSLALPVQLVGDTALHQHAHELAAQYKLSSTYAAHCLALAERLSVEFWTADLRLFKAMQASGVDGIRLVEK